MSKITPIVAAVWFDCIRPIETEMNLDADGWLVNFIQEDIPSMSAAEIVHRLVALREIENAPYFVYLVPVRDEGREWLVHRDPEIHDGYTRLRLDWLMEELRRRGYLGGDVAANN